MYRIIMLILCCNTLGIAQIEEVLIEKAIEKIEEAVAEDTENEEEVPEEDDLYDQTYRTSEEENEKGTRYDFNHLRDQPSGKRIACICMDGARQLNKGFGACAGRGGVRFWIWKTEDGNEIKKGTQRHALHPDDLSPEELQNLAAHQPKQTSFGKSNFGNRDFYDFAIVFVVCATIAYLAKLYFDNQREDDQLPL